MRGAHPGGLNPPPVAGLGVGPCLRGIEIGAEVARMAGSLLFEFCAVKAADGILAVALNQHPFCLVSISIHRQFEEVRTLKAVANGFALILPIQQIRGRKNMVLTVSVKQHDPVMAGLMPENFGVSLRINHKRVLFVMLPGASVIQAEAEAKAAIVIARPERDHRRSGWVGRQSGSVLVIHNARSRLV